MAVSSGTIDGAAADRCCGIAVGSNLGDRLENLRCGVRRLLEQAPGLRLRAVAPLFETEPVGCAPGTQAFYNSVVVVEVTDAALTPHGLRRMTEAVERWSGRPETRDRNAPRTLDLDLLFWGQQCAEDAELTLPHPRLGQRRFVLEPLAAVAGGLRLPGDDRTVAERLAALPPGEEVRRVCGGEWFGV